MGDLANPRTCGREGCDESLEGKQASAKWCSYRCKGQESYQLEHERRVREREQRDLGRICAVSGCDVSLAGRHANTKWCSNCVRERMREKQARRQRERRAADPEYRDLQASSKRERRAVNPELRERYNASRRERHAAMVAMVALADLRTCAHEGCDVSLAGRRLNTKVCSQRCWRIIQRIEQLKRQRDDPRDDPRTCAREGCDVSLAGKRRSTKFCSGRCWGKEHYATDHNFRERRIEAAHLQRLDPTWQRRHNARHRERVATDPTFRERINAELRKRYATDQDFRERQLESTKAAQRKRWATDQDFRERRRIMKRTKKYRERTNARANERYATDAEYRELLLIQARIHRPTGGPRRIDIYDRDGGRCTYCHDALARTGTWHIDHIHPVSLGGTADPANLALACARCNLRKGARPLEWKQVAP